MYLQSVFVTFTWSELRKEFGPWNTCCMIFGRNAYPKSLPFMGWIQRCWQVPIWVYSRNIKYEVLEEEYVFFFSYHIYIYICIYYMYICIYFWGSYEFTYSCGFWNPYSRSCLCLLFFLVMKWVLLRWRWGDGAGKSWYWKLLGRSSGTPTFSQWWGLTRPLLIPATAKCEHKQMPQ